MGRGCWELQAGMRDQTRDHIRRLDSDAEKQVVPIYTLHAGDEYEEPLPRNLSNSILRGCSSLTHRTTLETPTATSSSVITSCSSTSTSLTLCATFSTLLGPVRLLTLTELLI
jgi:hypothetical protein